MKISLPLIDARRKWVAAAVWYLAFCAIYSYTGLGPFGSPATLPLWLPDRLIPFLDWTIWIYASQFLLLYLCFAGLRNAGIISRMVASISLASLLAFCVFLIYPTTFQREGLAPAGMAGEVFGFLYSIDSAANCFPSLHVALAWLSAFSLREQRPKAGPIVLLWAALISVSTVTTKQHYFVDVLGGGALVLFCRWAIGKIAWQHRSLPEIGRNIVVEETGPPPDGAESGVQQ